jgi:protein TonB
MGYAEQQRQPGKHAVGIGVVIILHILLGWALASGLATKAVRIILPETEAVIIVEKPKPPPPPLEPPPPPKQVVVVQTFVPPPEVQIQQQLQPPVIQNTTVVAPPVFAPPTPPAPPAPIAPPAPVSVGIACPNSQQIRSDIKYPTQARKDGLQGEVLIEATVGANGEIKDVEVISSSNRAFNSISINSVRLFKCNAQGRDVRVQVPFSFKLSD